MSKELTIKSTAELNKAVEALLDYANGSRKFTFEGEIGAGKTTFIKELCAHLGVQEHTSSPTFSIVNEYIYPIDNSSQEGTIYHMDLYRLKSEEEAIAIGIEEYLYDDKYCFIEWPALIENLLPETCIKIKIEITKDSYRKILFL